jgi:hypothetical protein
MLSHRAEQLDNIAFQLGMEFSARDEWGLINYLEDFKLFRRGFSKRISNILHRQDEMLNLGAYIFDYRFTISAGNSARVIRQTVFFIESRKLELPIFYMRPEHIFHRIGEFLGMQDIDFEEYPVFSGNYVLRGEDEDFIRDSMDDPFLRFFSVENKWYLEGINYYLLFYRRGKLLKPEQIREFYSKGLEIYKLLVTE